MNWKRAITLGILLWILMFVIVSVFIGFKIYDFTITQVITIIISGIIAFVLAGRVRPKSAGTALGYGFCWVLVGVILDAVVTMRFNPAIFSMWPLWLGYALVFLVPLLRVKKS